MVWGTILRTLACCLLLAAATLCAQTQPESLDQLIQTALERNPTLRSVRLQSEASRLSAKAAGALPDPQVGIGILNLPQSSLALDETPMSGVQIGLTQMIPWPGKLSSRSDLADLSAQMSEHRARQVASRIVREVTTSFHDWIWWTSGQRILKENLALTKAMAEVARTRYANGNATMQEVLRARNAHDRLLNRMRVFARSANSALLELQRLVDDTTLTLPDSLADLRTLSSADKGEAPLTIETNPLLRQADLGVHRANASLSLARADYWPDLSLGVDYRFRKNIPMDPLEGEDFLSFRVGLTVPLWFFNNQKHKTASARVAVEASRAHQSAVRTQLQKQARDIRRIQATLRDNIDAYDNTILPQAKAAWESARAAYEVGSVDFDALLAAQLDWLNADLERLELLRNYHQKQAELNEIIGHHYEG